MGNHVSACLKSSQLCERLFNELNKKIGQLVYKKGLNKCSIRGTGTIFAWVNSHNATVGRLNIWFLGDADKAKKFSGLDIRPRSNPQNAGGWRKWGGSFSINNDAELAEAVELLSTISYPQSLH